MPDERQAPAGRAELFTDLDAWRRRAYACAECQPVQRGSWTVLSLCPTHKAEETTLLETHGRVVFWRRDEHA